MDTEEKIMGMPPSSSFTFPLSLFLRAPFPSHQFDFPFLSILILSLGRKRVENSKEKSYMFCTNLWIEKFM